MSEVALVTGASRGIGAAIAHAFAEQGLFVIGTATTASGAEKISASLSGRGRGLIMDIGSPQSVVTAMESLDSEESPAILVNNAGITNDNLMLRMSEDEWTRVIDVNVNGLYRVTKAVLRGMLRKRWGRIVNVGSTVGRMGNPGQANYVASKAAVEGFSRSLAIEVASRNITVNTVAPGFIATDMTDELTEDQKSAMLERIPAGRMGEPDDVVGVVCFLVSAEAGYITGQTIQVNGGMFAA